MAEGAKITISVPDNLKGQIMKTVGALRRLNKQLKITTGWATAARGAMRGQANVSQMVAKRMGALTKTIGSYTKAEEVSTQATNQMSSALQRTARYTHRLGISMYVLGGHFTSLARVMMGVSVVIETYQTMLKENGITIHWFENTLANLQRQFKNMGKAIARWAKNMYRSIKYAVLRSIRTMSQMSVIGPIILRIRRAFYALRGAIWSSLGPILLVAGALTGLGVAGYKVGQKFAPLEDQLQRTIEASSLTQDQFKALTNTVLQLTKELKVFTAVEVGKMLKQMAFAGAISENFKATAKAIAHIAYISGMEIEDITRDLARLAQQTGSSYKKLANTILATFTKASISYEDTVETFQQAGLILRANLGVTLNQVGAMSVLMSRFGYTGSRAASSIRAIAAEASQLKSGLENTQGIMANLGIQSMYEGFVKGRVSLTKLIKEMGRAGASFGQFASLFRKRAAIAANAVATFPKEFDKLSDAIAGTTDKQLTAFNKLAKTQAGMKKQMKAMKSWATQQWASLFAPFTKMGLESMKKFWNILGKIGQASKGVFEGLKTGFFVLTGGITMVVKILTQVVRDIVWLAQKVAIVTDFLTEITTGLEANLSGEIKGVLGGFNDTIDYMTRTIKDMADRVKVARKKADNYFLQAIGMEKGKGLGIAAESRKQHLARLQDAQDEFKKSLQESIKTINKLQKTLLAERLEKIVGKIEDFGQVLIGSKSKWEYTLNDITDRFKELASAASPQLPGLSDQVGEELKGALPNLFNKLVKGVTGNIGSLMALQQTVTYVDDAFQQVNEQLNEMFGTLRTVNRRGAARVQGGGYVGKVRGKEGTAASFLQRIFPKKDLQKMVQRFRNRQDKLVSSIKSNLAALYQEGTGIQTMSDVFASVIEDMTGKELTNGKALRQYFKQWDVARGILEKKAEKQGGGTFGGIGSYESWKSLKNAAGGLQTSSDQLNTAAKDLQKAAKTLKGIEIKPGPFYLSNIVGTVSEVANNFWKGIKKQTGKLGQTLLFGIPAKGSEVGGKQTESLSLSPETPSVENNLTQDITISVEGGDNPEETARRARQEIENISLETIKMIVEHGVSDPEALGRALAKENGRVWLPKLEEKNK